MLILNDFCSPCTRLAEAQPQLFHHSRPTRFMTWAAPPQSFRHRQIIRAWASTTADRPQSCRLTHRTAMTAVRRRLCRHNRRTVDTTMDRQLSSHRSHRTVATTMAAHQWWSRPSRHTGASTMADRARSCRHIRRTVAMITAARRLRSHRIRIRKAAAAQRRSPTRGDSRTVVQ